MPANSHLEGSHAAEDALFLTIFGGTLSSVPIFSPMQQDSMSPPTYVSDDEPSGAAVSPSQSLGNEPDGVVTPSERTTNEPGAVNMPSFSLLGNHTVQPSSVSTGVQQTSNADTISTSQGSPTLHPNRITPKVCTVHHLGILWH